MAIRNIVTTGDPVLTKVCRSVEKFDARLHALLEDMKETLVAANGVGLAAPQVGLMRRICIVDIGDGIIELINPVITEAIGVQEEAEGCLSFPGEFGMVERPKCVTVKAQNRKGEFYEIMGTDLLARAFCHEIDHLNGVLFITKVSRMLTDEELNGDTNNEEVPE